MLLAALALLLGAETAQAQAVPVVSISRHSQQAETATEGATLRFQFSPNPAQSSSIAIKVQQSGGAAFGISERTVTEWISGSGGSIAYGTENDFRDEPDADVTLTILAGAGYTVGSSSSATVTIQDDDVLPGAPTISSVAAGAGQLTVAWSAPADPGYSDGTDDSHSDNTVTAYDVRHILASAADKSDAHWTVVDNAWTSGNLQYRIASLTNGQSYDVQVRANTRAGVGPWSTTSTATPQAGGGTSQTPVVTVARHSEQAETATEGATLRFTVTASPAPSSQNSIVVNMRRSGGAAFGLSDATPTVGVGSSGTADFAYTSTNDALDEPDADLTVTVQAGTGYTAGTPASATVTIQDNDALPGRPSISTVTAGVEQLTVAWSVPSDPGYSDGTDVSHTDNAVTAYDVRYILTSAADKSDGRWTVMDNAWTSGTLQYAIESLAGESYDVQVRAVTRAGDGPWSTTSTGTPRDDTTAPTFSRATVNGATLTVTFNENLDSNSASAGSAFTVSGGRTGTGTAAISGARATVTVSYVQPMSNPLRDVTGNEVVNFSGKQVSNVTGDTTAPTFSRATVDGTTITVTFSENLDPDVTPAGSAFSVSGGRTGRGTAAISGIRAKVTLDSAVSQGETVTVNYVQPTSNPLRDVAGNEVASFADQPVTNNTRAPGTPPPPPTTPPPLPPTPPPPPNQPPTVTLSCAPCEVERGGEATLTATASDPNGDPLTYAWSASDGVIAGAGDTAAVRWTAPDRIGTVTIRVEVSDGEGGAAEAKVAIEVLVVLPERTPFDILHRGTATSKTGGQADSPRVGYGLIRADGGMATPSGIALFEFRDSEGVLITEASVPAAAPVRKGRIFAEVGDSVNTAVAFANPNGRPVDISFYLTDTAGSRTGEGSFTLEAFRHQAALLNAPPFEVAGVVGTFTFQASAPVAVIALRGAANQAGEWLGTTLPVTPLLPPPSPFSRTSTDPLVFPHFSNGQGWGAQVILVNPTRQPIAGTLEFLGPDAAPLRVTLDDGRMGASFPYSIAAHSAWRVVTANSADQTVSGSVRATPASVLPPVAAPSGLLVYSFTDGGKTVSQVGVLALPSSTAFRVPIAAAGQPGQPGSIRTGLAVVNTADAESTVSLEITRPDGSLLLPPASLALPPGGQTARLLDQVFNLPEDFSSGLLRVSASNGEVSVVALRFRVNQRGELKTTTIWPRNENAPATSEDRYFAHLADSGGWTTELILFSGALGETGPGTLSLFWFPIE